MNYTKGRWYISCDGHIMVVDNAYKAPICQMPFGSNKEADEMPEAEANAHLIAAAPDMYEALQSVLLRLDLEAKEKGDDAIFPCAAMRDNIRQTLNKAEGNDG